MAEEILPFYGYIYKVVQVWVSEDQFLGATAKYAFALF